LTADGVCFTANGAADSAQRITADDLTLLLTGVDDTHADDQDTAERTPKPERGDARRPVLLSARGRRPALRADRHRFLLR